MTTEIQANIAKPQRRFLERWAYWIIGGVVLMGFANIRRLWLLRTLVRLKQIT